ncbi:predicted protein [Aspergillus terreus NIH2624]|uniref:Uncharacterized protein n=1 Tax=Aspergillus terreus (strain NIH 2624 / FGSC A1156) TaxID=341663 RepID=Q0D141_ASPTN|nr:uncharacterized protein ATEG_00343 [Aspergillus terreus NIH2624]EAU38989.1 predicted protein [Aspergillus terreus NIH2624]
MAAADCNCTRSNRYCGKELLNMDQKYYGSIVQALTNDGVPTDPRHITDSLFLCTNSTSLRQNWMDAGLLSYTSMMAPTSYLLSLLSIQHANYQLSRCEKERFHL